LPHQLKNSLFKATTSVFEQLEKAKFFLDMDVYTNYLLSNTNCVAAEESKMTPCRSVRAQLSVEFSMKEVVIQ